MPFWSTTFQNTEEVLRSKETLGSSLLSPVSTLITEVLWSGTPRRSKSLLSRWLRLQS